MGPSERRRWCSTTFYYCWILPISACRRLVDKTTKAGSFAAVVASCGSITAAYPVQQLFIRPIYMNGECRASNFSGGITDVQVAQEKCIGYYATESLLVPFVVFFLIALVIWLLFVLRHVRRNS